MIVLDTHALIWARLDDKKLGRRARLLIEKNWQQERVAVSAISFWEAGQLQARKRVLLPAPVGEWRQTLLDQGLHEIALDGVIAMRALDLSALPNDPADRFIAATALVRGAVLVTADEGVLAWKHSLERHDARI